ncbi:MAG: ABC transporter permease [Gaiellaceae bacterium]
MIRVALKGLAGRKLRAMLTAFAIVLGVAMVSGTYVLTDTIKAGFGAVFTTVYKSTDAIITGKSAIGGSNDQTGAVPSFDASLLAKVRALPGVAEASGGVADLAQFVGRNGKVISGHGAPGLAFSVNAKGDQRFNPLVLTAGRYPQGPTEVAIDASTASKKHYAVGDTIGAIARGPVRQYRITGIVQLGGVSSLGGATMAIFDLPTAQQLFRKQGKLDSISVAAKPGTSTAQLVNEIRPILPATAQVRSGQQQAAKDTANTSAFTSILQKFLLAFGGIALFVGIFVIANTLSITIAQRAREFGTLRTLGATRRQLLSSVILEGFVIGTLASLTGLFAGLGLAKGLNSVFVAFGIDLPKAGTVFAARTVVVSLVVGILVTLLASLMPAIRATRVEPIAAVREGSLPPSRLERFGVPVALVTLAVGVALLAFGAFASGSSTTDRLLAIGFGVVVVFIGMALLAPKFVPPLARTLGAPAAHSGVSGTLARQNAMRNPARTASTAAALMIGLALVTAVAVLASGLKARFEGAVNELFRADYALTSENGFTPTGIDSQRAVAKVPGVQFVSGIRAGEGKVFGKRVGVTAVDPHAQQVISADWIAGGNDVPAKLGLDGAFVDKDYATSHALSVGSPLTLETPTGTTLQLRLKGIFDPPKGGSPYGRVTISTALFDRSYQSPQNLFAFLRMRGGVTDANTKALDAALARFPDAKIQTEAQFKKAQEAGINILLNLLYVLLSLSIVVSLFGIVNTMVLTVFERTRELGMLRAVGMTRRQVRRMIRHESVVTALIGAALGIPLGIGIAGLVGRAISFVAFTVPWGSLVAFVVAAIVVGLLAAIFPARRASRLNVLEALHYE